MFKKKAFLIVFEGIEGSGKSYQAKKLFNKLKKKRIETILTREPGGTASAEIIRNVILKDYFEKNKKLKFDKLTDTLLYMAARNEHIKQKIIPALKKKKVIICDRFIDSTYAYQIDGKKVSNQFIKNIHKFILRGIKPDLTIVLKVKKSSFIRRLKKRKTKNRYDNFPIKFYLKAQRAFLKIAKNKSKYLIFESSENSSKLENIIYQNVLNRINN